MATQIKLQEPILDRDISSINYFTGRLLTASDLSREKAANREFDRRLGRAIGDGVAYGLEVRVSPESKIEAPALRIEAGLAVNRMGQTLSLRNPTDLTLARQAEAGASGSSLFTECQPIQTGTYIAGQGVYLLTIAPAESRKGRALVSGLGNEAASCNTDTIIESVQFRLIQLNSFLDQGEMSDERLLRNRVAYRCFGVTQTAAFTSDPFGPPLERYGLLDDLRASVLSDCDAPLALIYWTLSGGIEFVDMWAVRRRLTKRATADRWSPLVDDRRMSEGEAMFLQFQDHIETLCVFEPNPETLSAGVFFKYLPPVGVLPLKRNNVKGIGIDSFFAGITHREPEFVDGSALRNLMGEAVNYNPVDLTQGEMVWLYKAWQNEKELSAGPSVRPYVIFTSGHLPCQSIAHFDLARWEYSNYAHCESCEN